MFRAFLFLFLVSFALIAEDESKLKPGAELKIDVSFLPDELAEFNGQKLLAKDFLPTVAHKLNPLAKEKTSPALITRYIISLIQEKYNRKVSLELAGLAGVEPNIGLSFLELQKMEKDLGKKALTEKLLENGVSYEEAPKFMAESKAIDEWFKTKILPENQVNEAEALLYYSENQDQLKQPERVKFAQIFTGFFLEEEKRQARKKITEAHYDLSIGKKFAETAKKYSEGRLAENGGVEEKFYSRDELPDELKLLFDMKVEETSKVIQSNSGFHIIKVLEKRKAGIPKFSEVKNGLILTMSLEKARASMNQLIKERKKELGFKIFLGQ